MHILIALLLTCACCYGIDWSNPVDQMNKPRGYFTNSPFPITESSTSYALTNDEGTITFALGTLYFVDGAKADDSGDGLSLGNAKKTIGAALTAAGTGNKTIVVRGAHDGFDGVYVGTYSMSSYAGTGNTNRFMIVGYGQERPILDANYSTSSIFNRSHASYAYITIQRLKLINTKASGVRLGWDVTEDKRDQYFSMIDIWCYDCGNSKSEEDSFLTNGSVYYLNTDYGFIHHCTFEHSVGHGAKLGDGTSHGIMEWCVLQNNGWWAGRTGFTNSRTVGIDMPSDRDTSTNMVIRYNLCKSTVSHGLQARRVHGFYIHHNEITDYGKGPGLTGDMAGVTPYGILIASTSNGRIENNIVHTPDPANTNGMLVEIQSDLTADITLYNNLLYDSPSNQSALYLDVNNQAFTKVYHNTIIQSNAAYVITQRAGQATNQFVNNIIVQWGTGRLAEMVYHSVAPLHQGNIYYYPSGTAPEWGTTGDTVANPLMLSFATGSFTTNFYSWATNSPALNAGVSFTGTPTTDIADNTRSQPDVGAWEGYTGGGSSSSTLKPASIRRK